MLDKAKVALTNNMRHDHTHIRVWMDCMQIRRQWGIAIPEVFRLREYITAPSWLAAVERQPCWYYARMHVMSCSTSQRLTFVHWFQETGKVPVRMLLCRYTTCSCSITDKLALRTGIKCNMQLWAAGSCNRCILNADPGLHVHFECLIQHQCVGCVCHINSVAYLGSSAPRPAILHIRFCAGACCTCCMWQLAEILQLAQQPL